DVATAQHDAGPHAAPNAADARGPENGRRSRTPVILGVAVGALVIGAVSLGLLQNERSPSSDPTLTTASGSAPALGRDVPTAPSASASVAHGRHAEKRGATSTPTNDSVPAPSASRGHP